MFKKVKEPRILLAEDNSTQLMQLRSYLEADYEIIPASTLEEALKNISSSIDLVLTDLSLDPLNPDDKGGIEILKESKIRIPSVPVIVMTAYGKRGLANEVLRLGGLKFLSKPLNLESLEKTIDSALVKKARFSEKIKSRLSAAIPPFLFFFFIVAVWEAATRIFHIPQYLFPSPSSIWLKIQANIGLLLQNLQTTALEAILGFFIGGGIAFIVAIIFAHSIVIEKSIYPYFIALQSVPLIAIAPLLVIWFGNGLFGKLVMSAVICFFPVVVNMAVGFKSIKNDEWDLFRLLSASKAQVFTKLRLPSSLPFLFSAAKISITLSVIGAIVAELAGSNKGLGFMILIASYRTDTVMMFAAIIFAAILGILLFLLISAFEKAYYLKRHRDGHQGK